MRIQRAQSEAGAVETPPGLEGVLNDASGPNDTMHGEQSGHVSEGHMGGDQDHAERGSAVAGAFGRQHHCYVYVAGEMGQPLGVAGIGEACQVKGVLMGGSSDNGVHLTAERHSSGRLDGVSGNPAGPPGASVIRIGLAGAESPNSHTDVAGGGKCGDLIFRADQDNICGKRLGQSACGDLGTDPARIAQRNRYSRVLTT